MPEHGRSAILCFINALLLTYYTSKYSKYTTVTIKCSDFKLTQNAANAEPQKWRQIFVKVRPKFGRIVHTLPSRMFGRIVRPKFGVRGTLVRLYSALPEETWTPEILSFQLCCMPCLENDTASAWYVFDTHHLSNCRPLAPPSRQRTAQCSPVLRQQRTPSATRRTLADNAAGVQQRCRATSHCSARRRDRSASWLATLQWTLFHPRRRQSRQRVPGTSEAAAAVSYLRHDIQHDWKDTISGVRVSQVMQRQELGEVR